MLPYYLLQTAYLQFPAVSIRETPALGDILTLHDALFGRLILINVITQL